MLRTFTRYQCGRVVLYVRETNIQSIYIKLFRTINPKITCMYMYTYVYVQL